MKWRLSPTVQPCCATPMQPARLRRTVPQTRRALTPLWLQCIICNRPRTRYPSTKSPHGHGRGPKGAILRELRLKVSGSGDLYGGKMKRGWMTSKTVLFRARMLSNFGKTTEADQTCLRSVSIAAADRLISIVQKRR